MRQLASCLAFLFVMTPVSPASADLNSLLAGVNSLITFPADPVMSTVHPPEPLDELPAPEVTGRFVGFFAGTLQAVYRATMGTLDIVFAPLWIFPVLSPEPRYDLTGADYEF